MVRFAAIIVATRVQRNRSVGGRVQRNRARGRDSMIVVDEIRGGGGGGGEKPRRKSLSRCFLLGGKTGQREGGRRARRH